MKKTTLLLVLALAAPLGAAGLSKHKDWADSPEAYFLTKAEREAWAKVDGDAAAEKFIEGYRATRGKGFAAAIQSRIDFADKNFVAGKKKGSQTLRGKVLVIFGPPARVDTQVGTAAGGANKVDPTSGELTQGDTTRSATNVLSNAGGPGADSMSTMRPVEKKPTVFQWKYDARTVPPPLKMPSLTLEFSVDEKGNETTPQADKLGEWMSTIVEAYGPKPAPAPK